MAVQLALMCRCGWRDEDPSIPPSAEQQANEYMWNVFGIESNRRFFGSRLLFE